ncbi:hypothetical protein QU38_01355, partial [Staphylococcus aureus]
IRLEQPPNRMDRHYESNSRALTVGRFFLTSPASADRTTRTLGTAFDGASVYKMDARDNFIGA